MKEIKEDRLIKRKKLLNNYKPIDSWKNWSYSIYHKNYIINENGKLWLLTQSFTNDNEIWEYFYWETLKVVRKTEWYEFWESKYEIIKEPYWDN